MIYCTSLILTVLPIICRAVVRDSATYLSVTACASSAVSYPKSVFHRTHSQRFSYHYAVSWKENKTRRTPLQCRILLGVLDGLLKPLVPILLRRTQFTCMYMNTLRLGKRNVTSKKFITASHCIWKVIIYKWLVCEAHSEWC